MKFCSHSIEILQTRKRQRHTVLHCHFSVCNECSQTLLLHCTSSFAVPDRVGQTESTYNTNELEKKQNANSSSPVVSYVVSSSCLITPYNDRVFGLEIMQWFELGLLKISGQLPIFPLSFMICNILKGYCISFIQLIPPNGRSLGCWIGQQPDSDKILMSTTDGKYISFKLSCMISRLFQISIPLTQTDNNKNSSRYVLPQRPCQY